MASKKFKVILKQIFGEKINEEHELTGSEATIGRSPKCSIILSSPSVSRRHCILTYSNGVWNIMDNKSQNGTFINGRRLGPAEKYDLQYGDIVFLGPPSEMPQAFSYEEHHEEDMETDDDDDIIELPPMKRRCEEDVTTPVKKLVKCSDTEINIEYGSVASGSESHSQNLSKDNTKTKSENLDTHNYATPITKDCIKKESTASKSKHFINENSSSGSDNYGNSESLLDEGIASYIDPTISYYPEEHWESNKRKSRNSQKSKELEIKLALLSEEIKALQESKLQLLKKYEDVCEKNKVLDKQLTEKQKELEDDLKQHEVRVKNEVKSELLKKFEEELVCNICTELFIKPVVLDCSHTFCEYCIKEWKKKKNDCPICRCKIKNSIRIRTLEEFIDKILTTLTPEQRLTRENAKAQRILAEQPRPSAQTPRRRRGSARRQHSRHSRRNVVNANISVEIVEEILEPSRTNNLRRISRSNVNSSNAGDLNQEDLGLPTHSRTIRRHNRPSNSSGNQYPDGSISPSNFLPYDVQFRLPALSAMGFFY